MPALSPTAAVAEVGEHRLIAELAARLRSTDAVLLGAGDDAAIVEAPDGRVVVSTDAMVEGRHWRPTWSTGNDVGRRLAGANLADVAAMGARPVSLVVSLALPPDTLVGWVFDLIDGLVAEADLAGAAVVGGDLSSGPSIVASATALGSLDRREPVRRSGAQPGDVVAVCGRLGWAAAGLTVLSRGFKAPRALVQAHRFPEPPYSAGPLAAMAGATAMIDVSDGLVSDLGHLAFASDVDIELDTDRIRIDGPVSDAAAAFNADPLVWALSGGDDHSLAATFPAAADLPEGFYVIGRVGSRTGEAGQVRVDGQPRPELRGWDHFA